MPKLIDLSGQRFERLLVTPKKKTEKDVVLWWCKCDCGVEKWIAARSLRSGRTLSCGCLNRELTGKRSRELLKQYKVVLSAQQREDFTSSLKNQENTPDKIAEISALLLVDEGPWGPAKTDSEAGSLLGLTRGQIEWIRTAFVAPEAIKEKTAKNVRRARATPEARKKTKERYKRYYSKPEVQKKLKQYRQNLPPEVRARKNERTKAYRQTPEGKAARKKEAERARELARTPEGKARKRKYVQRYKPKANKRYKERYESEPQFRVAVVLRKRILMALKTRGISKSRSVRELIGCTIPDLRQHLEAQFRDGMSWQNHGEWHIDHIMPCAAFDLTSLEEQKKCFHFSNLQPLWAEENMRKSNKLPDA